MPRRRPGPAPSWPHRSPAARLGPPARRPPGPLARGRLPGSHVAPGLSAVTGADVAATDDGATDGALSRRVNGRDLYPVKINADRPDRAYVISQQSA